MAKLDDFSKIIVGGNEISKVYHLSMVVFTRLSELFSPDNYVYEYETITSKWEDTHTMPNDEIPRGNYKVTVSLTTYVDVSVFGTPSSSDFAKVHTVTINTKNLTNKEIVVTFAGYVSQNYPVTVTFVKV